MCLWGKWGGGGSNCVSKCDSSDDMGMQGLNNIDFETVLELDETVSSLR